VSRYVYALYTIVYAPLLSFNANLLLYYCLLITHTPEQAVLAADIFKLFRGSVEIMDEVDMCVCVCVCVCMCVYVCVWRSSYIPHHIHYYKPIYLIRDVSLSHHPIYLIMIGGYHPTPPKVRVKLASRSQRAPGFHPL
jgi:hypothetical protein